MVIFHHTLLIVFNETWFLSFSNIVSKRFLTSSLPSFNSFEFHLSTKSRTKPFYFLLNLFTMLFVFIAHTSNFLLLFLSSHTSFSKVVIKRSISKESSPLSKTYQDILYQYKFHHFLLNKTNGIFSPCAKLCPNRFI